MIFQVLAMVMAGSVGVFGWLKKHSGMHCGNTDDYKDAKYGTSITKWADGTDANYNGKHPNVAECKRICEAHPECTGFVRKDYVCWKKLCTSCDYSGSETKVSTGGTLNECQASCEADTNCKAIDFGKGRWANECYHNYADDGKSYGADSSFDAYIPEKCGETCNWKSNKLKPFVLDGHDCYEKDCDVTRSKCCDYRIQYPGMIPYKSWGSTPNHAKQWYNDNDCNSVVGGTGLFNCPYNCRDVADIKGF